MTTSILKNICGGRFVIKAPLGDPGTEATAYLAEDVVLGLEIVCRVARHPAALDAFKKQFRILVAATSSGLVRPLGFFVDDATELPVIELERVQGQTLASWRSDRSAAERLRAYLALVEAVELLHRAGGRHGDVHIDNVIIDQGRVVLVDPDSSAFGSTHRRDGGQSRTVETDRRGTARVFEDLFTSEERSGSLGVLANTVMNEGVPLGELAIVVRNLASHSGLDPADSKDAAKIGSWWGKNVEQQKALFVRCARARDGAFQSLQALVVTMIEEARAGGAPELGVSMADASLLEKELATAAAPRSRLEERRMSITTNEGHRWDLLLPAHNDFVRPWPQIPGRKRSVLDLLHSQVSRSADIRLVNDLELRRHLGEPGRVSLLRNNGGMGAPPDVEWVKRCLRVLSGSVLPVLESPESVGEAKRTPSEWDTPDVQLPSWIVLESDETDLKLRWLQREVGAMFKQLKRQMQHALELHDAPAKAALRRLVEDALLTQLGAYFIGVEAFDVVLDMERGDIEAHLLATPVGTHGVVWAYRFRLGP